MKQGPSREGWVVEEIRAFYETHRFTAVLTPACQWPDLWLYHSISNSAIMIL
jgi:hypothetical protein